MKPFKISTLAFIFFCSLVAVTTANAKTAPLSTAVAPVDMTVAAPQYGNTTVTPVQTDAPPVQASQSMSNNQSGSNLYVHLPINNGLIFLFLSAIVIGVKVIIGHSNKPKAQTN